MPTTIRIPNPDELDERLAGVDRLLIARAWEKAAIVFAYTDIGAPRNTPGHTPEPPRLNIRQFAERGFAGLSTAKAVHRYRDAWVTAISNGWAVPVDPGDEVELPEAEFPAWGAERVVEGDAAGAGADEPTESADREHRAPRGTYGRTRRSPEQLLLHHLDGAASSLRRVSVSATQLHLSERTREAALARVAEVERWKQEVLSVLAPPPRPEPEWSEPVEVAPEINLTEPVPAADPDAPNVAADLTDDVVLEDLPDAVADEGTEDAGTEDVGTPEWSDA